ncbi:putative centrosomal protein of 41 kDa (Cep41 protein) (Testis-specificprotein A14 protein) [Schistosoma mansoni]|uniref:putative centrosomal protein of 41 kDa (Cep41 protein) (Testis-specificprotein A14 protein) n=1 Tax=Schistosoma mansoni TaxID=6183 RepID=UPI0001A63EDA|nr:putative centrosomal protein of 41 kDa (Cep41 protein) (Testis-specificprotein A14 protein) [Schistosoma mansoni]|eukprot:XP_018652271.1 putative centrosomal protein of 41 kDa (Cep41 protein) (Testis-specificprotein A14 protein) [Schistosoma mansoni]
MKYGDTIRIKVEIGEPLQKTIPRNPKYENIQPTIDTGASLSKYLKKMEEIRENYKMKDNEIFKRIKIPTFVQLILQISEVQKQQQQNNELNNHNSCSTPRNEVDNHINNNNKSTNGNGSTHGNVDPPLTERSTLESLVTGVGEFDICFGQSRSQIPDTTSKQTSSVDSPYLLLDVRDRDDYDACHIITALNYPIAMLSRSVNFETTEMLAYRNRPDHIIIVYDEDERLAPRAASTLVQRGYCNLFMLSGGLKVAWKLFPKGLIIGEMPLSISYALKLHGKTRISSRPSSHQGSIYNSQINQNSFISNSSTISLPLDRRSNNIPLIYCALGTRDNLDGCEEFLPEDIVHLTLTIEKGVDDGTFKMERYYQDVYFNTNINNSFSK